MTWKTFLSFSTVSDNNLISWIFYSDDKFDDI